jgi:hypothetical protein
MGRSYLYGDNTLYLEEDNDGKYLNFSNHVKSHRLLKVHNLLGTRARFLWECDFLNLQSTPCEIPHVSLCPGPHFTVLEYGYSQTRKPLKKPCIWLDYRENLKFHTLISDRN